MPTLTPEQERFCISVVSGESLKQSAISAGFSPGSAANAGSRWAKRADVRSRILELQAKQNESGEAGVGSKEWLVAEMADVYMMAKGRKPTPKSSNLSVARQQLLDMAKVKGHIAIRPDATERRISPDPSLPPTQMHTILVEMFGKLPPSERDRIALEDPELVESIDADYTVAD